MHALYILIIFIYAVTVVTNLSVSMNLGTIPSMPAMCRDPTSYTMTVTTTSAYSDNMVEMQGMQ